MIPDTLSGPLLKVDLLGVIQDQVHVLIEPWGGTNFEELNINRKEHVECMSETTKI